jgi:hypothetical protein
MDGGLLAAAFICARLDTTFSIPFIREPINNINGNINGGGNTLAANNYTSTVQVIQ